MYLFFDPNILEVDLFISFLAAPQPTLGHYWGDNLTHPMLIIALFSLNWSHLEPCNKVGFLSLDECLVGFKLGSSQIYHNTLTH